MKFKPYKNRILVERVEEETTDTGIIVTTSASKDRPLEGTVVAVGDEVDDIKVGDKIYFNKYSGSDVTIEGENYILLTTEDVQGVMEAD